MMSVNRVTLIGHLGQDPTVRYMQNGEAVANVSIATTEHWKDSQGVKHERTDWHNLVFYKRLAEIAGEYLKKGSQIYVEGKLQNNKWKDKEGKDRYSTNVVVTDLKMLGNGRSEDVTQQPETPPEEPKKEELKGTSFYNFEDDIPF